MLDRHHVAVADHHVGVAGQDRRHEGGDVGGRVLVVGVGVDDHVGTELEAGIEPGLEGVGQALVVRELHDVVDAELLGDLDRASVEPSSMTSHSTMSKPVDGAGASASAIGSWSSSLRHGIWMISFTGGPTVSGP